MAVDNSNEAQYENNLIHQRLTWLGTFEGLLFVANHYRDHPYLLPLAGFLIAISIDIGITATNRRLTQLGAQAYSNRWNHLMPGTAIPKIIAGAWMVLLLENSKWLSQRFSFGMFNHHQLATTTSQRWYAYPEWWLVIAAALTGIAIGYQAMEMARTIKVMRAQLGHLINSERAWVMDTIRWGTPSLPLARTTDGASQVSTSANVDLFWNNHGKTPAWVTEAQIKMLVTTQLPAEPDMANAEVFYGPSPAVPNAPPHRDGHRFFLQADGWAELGQITAIYGVIKYRDTFTPEGQSWETWFGYRVTPSAEIERLPAARYNRNS